MSNHKQTQSSPFQQDYNSPQRYIKDEARHHSYELSEGCHSICKRISTHDIHWIAQELRESHKKCATNQKLMKLSSFQTMEGTINENAVTVRKDAFLKFRMEDELQKHLKGLQMYSQPLEQQQRQQLQYVTFRLVKMDEKKSLISLKSTLHEKLTHKEHI